MGRSVLSTGEKLQSIWKLGGLTWKQLGVRVWNGIFDDNLLGRAAELAYNFILSVFPLFIMLLSIFGLYASHSSQLRQNLMFYLSRVLPPDAYSVVSHTISRLAANSGSGKITLGIVLTLFFASGGVNTMMSTLNGAYEVKEGRSWWKVRLIAIALTAALTVLIASALILVLVGGTLASFVGAKAGIGPAVITTWKVAQWPAVLFFIMFSFSLIYYFGPDVKEQHWYWITPGSVFGVLLWLVASFGFRVYLGYFNTYSKTYGSLGAVMILLVWLYVTGLAFVIGGEINAQIEHAAAMRGHPEAKAPGEKVAPADRQAA
jgi:membrane protein